MTESQRVLRELEELTPALPNLVAAPGSESVVVYKGEGGDSFGFLTWSSEDGAIATQRVLMPAGVRFPPHHHKEHEWLFVYKGRFLLTVDGEIEEVAPGGWKHIPPEVPHSATAVEDTWVFCVSMPAAEGYP